MFKNVCVISVDIPTDTPLYVLTYMSLCVSLSLSAPSLFSVLQRLFSGTGSSCAEVFMETLILISRCPVTLTYAPIPKLEPRKPGLFAV